jgi:hypothetical protein
MNEEDIQIGDLVFRKQLFCQDRKDRSIGLVVADLRLVAGRPPHPRRWWKVYWFKLGRIWHVDEYGLTKLCLTQEEQNE